MGGTQSKLDCSEETRRNDEKRYKEHLGKQETIIEKKNKDIRLLRDGQKTLHGRLDDEKDKQTKLEKRHGEEVGKLQNQHKEDIEELTKKVHAVISQHEYLGIESTNLVNEMNMDKNDLFDNMSILGNAQQVSFTIKGMVDSIREAIIRLEKGSDKITVSMEKEAIAKQKHRIRTLLVRLLSGGDHSVEYELDSMKDISRELKWKIDETLRTLASIDGIDGKTIERAREVLYSALAVAEELYTQIGVFEVDMAVKPSEASLGATRQCLSLLNMAVHGVPKMAKNFQESLMEEKKEAEIKSLEGKNRLDNAIATGKATILAVQGTIPPIEKP